MFLTVATTHQPATDLGFLLHKNPSRVHDLDLGFGRAVMFYPEATAARCEFAVTLDIDPVSLVRGRQGGGGLFDQYVNDRPYAASSFLSVAVARGIREAMAGRSRERPALADTAIPLAARVAPLPVRGRTELVERLFEPLGYSVEVTPHPLDPERPDWGDAPYVTLRLAGTARLADLLTHLYVLMPVLDDRKHYFVGEDELEKLLARGEGWLASHPERDLIVSRYLKRRGVLVRSALAQLVPDEAEPEGRLDPARDAAVEAAIERPLRRHGAALSRDGDRLGACFAGLRRAGPAPRHGPDYDMPEHLDRLRQRGLGAKRSLAVREFALGLEALDRFVAREPLRRVHECVFGVMALESEPVDPRL